MGIRLLGVAIVVVNVVFIIVGILAAQGDWTILIPIAAMIAAGVLGVLLALSYIYISITATAVQLGLWPLSGRVIRLSNVVNYAFVPDVRPSSFGGVGFRKTVDNRSAYLSGRGPGIELHTSDGETITLVLEEATEVIEVLGHKLGARPHG